MEAIGSWIKMNTMKLGCSFLRGLRLRVSKDCARQCKVPREIIPYYNLLKHSPLVIRFVWDRTSARTARFRIAWICLSRCAVMEVNLKRWLTSTILCGEKDRDQPSSPNRYTRHDLIPSLPASIWPLSLGFPFELKIIFFEMLETNRSSADAGNHETAIHFHTEYLKNRWTATRLQPLGAEMPA